MASLDQNKPMLDFMKEEKKDSFVKPLSSVKQENERDLMVLPKEKDIKEHNYSAADNAHENKRIKLHESGSSTLEKLQSFFGIVQKQHPESRLELQYVDGNWKVWCGACKKLLRPDKSGKAIHNIQRQHFASSRHKKKLHLMLQAEEEAERQQKIETKGGNEMHNSEDTDRTN